MQNEWVFRVSTKIDGRGRSGGHRRLAIPGL